MKRLIFLSFFMMFITQISAQTRIGLAAQPGILANRVSSDVDSLQVMKDGSRLKIWLGVFMEKELKENYFFITGLHWAPKRFGIKLGTGQEQEILNVKLQYLQMPFFLKLLTDEIALDKKIYFQMGPIVEIKIQESSEKKLSEFYIDKINFWDIGLHFSAGLDIKVGQNTIVAGGFSYYRGLSNIVKTSKSLDGNIRVKNDYYAINISIKF
jgi:hypothetical protein